MIVVTANRKKSKFTSRVKDKTVNTDGRKIKAPPRGLPKGGSKKRSRAIDLAKFSKRYLLSYFIFNSCSEEFFTSFNDSLSFERLFFLRFSRNRLISSFLKRKDEISLTGFTSSYGALARFFNVRWRHFFKRRSYNRIYYRLFYPIRDGGFTSFKRVFSSVPAVIFLRQTKNNVFFSVQSTRGRVLFTYTNGQTSYKGSRRCTPVACEAAGKRIAFLLSQNRVKKVSVIFGSQVNAFTRAAVKGLSNHLTYSAFAYKLTRAHNGIKQRASRRV